MAVDTYNLQQQAQEDTDHVVRLHEDRKRRVPNQTRSVTFQGLSHNPTPGYRGGAEDRTTSQGLWRRAEVRLVWFKEGLLIWL